MVGNPLTDSLAIITYNNCGILSVADGIGWGSVSKVSSNCAIYGSITYLTENILKCNNTRDIFFCILKSFENAQNLIINIGATMTTLCVGVIVELTGRNRYAFCVVNLGNTYAYIYNLNYGVKEVTEGSHSLDENCDMRLRNGALGPAVGCNPDLTNLTLSYVVLEKGDLVFLCSDGISDNFDPVIAKFQPRFKLKENSPIMNYESKIESDSFEHCRKDLNENGLQCIACGRRGSSIDINEKILQSKGENVHQYDSTTKTKNLAGIFKSTKNKLHRSISNQSIRDIFPPILKLDSSSLDSLYVSLTDLLKQKKSRTKSIASCPDFDNEENTFSFNCKDSETMIETLSLTPRERHRGILEQMKEV